MIAEKIKNSHDDSIEDANINGEYPDGSGLKTNPEEPRNEVFILSNKHILTGDLENMNSGNYSQMSADRIIYSRMMKDS